MRPLLTLLALLSMLLSVSGCDMIGGMLGLPDPAKAEADGKAIGAACRNSGRGLEDCYSLNTRASKAAVYAGWKEMNEYMISKGMEAQPPEIQPDTKGGHKAKKKKKDAEADAADAAASEGAAKQSDPAAGKEAAAGKEPPSGKVQAAGKEPEKAASH